MDPRIMPDQNEEKTFRQWVMKESNRLSETVNPMGGPTQKRMLAYWKQNRPEMWERLLRMGIAKELAHVLDEKCEETIRKNLKAGMYLTDAREQAEQDWLLLEPENEEEPESEEL